MIWIEIPVRHEPIIYRAKRFMGLVPREQRKKVYKFANQPQAMRLLKKYDFDAGFIQGRLIWDMLTRADWIPEIYPVQRRKARAEIRAILAKAPASEIADEIELEERIEHYERAETDL
ncbi:hypothetical protein [Chelatococcus asaccharovorans]|nr:hypothetical protein [Chelatococcus asaccharovorans]MBS7708170.1 hypothetical protein [Chelatococcus asaccharovorans]